MGRILTLLLLSAVSLLNCSTELDTDWSNSTLALPGRDAVNRAWAAAQPLPSDTFYAAEPSWSGSYTAGSAAAGLRANGLRMANFVRFLAGLPADLQLDEDLNDLGQHGAVLLKAGGTLTHTPGRPPDMPEDFYNRGYSSTTSANIASGYTSLSRSILNGYMPDDSQSNSATVGHRRWILHPPLKKIGFGYCEGFSTMQVFDKSRSTPFDYNWIAWPAGEFPTACFDSNDPWSLTLNPARYQQPANAAITVTLERTGTNTASWTLNAADAVWTTGGDYFMVNTGGYGINNCIIFRPGAGFTCNPGDSYRVTVEGARNSDGSPAEISYTVNFFAVTTPPVNPLGTPQTRIGEPADD